MPRERRRSTTEDSSAGRNITFAKTVNAAAAGVQGLTANTAGTTTFGGAVGNNARLANVTTDAAGTTDLNGGAVNTTGNQTYNDDVILTANTTVDSSGAGTLTFAKTVNAAASGVQGLTANTAGTTIFQGAVGNNTRLASLTTDAAGTTAINDGGQLGGPKHYVCQDSERGSSRSAGIDGEHRRHHDLWRRGGQQCASREP